MNDRQEFKTLVDGIYGAGTCTFDETSNETNNVIAALAGSRFVSFRENFAARLGRLNELYGAHPDRGKLLVLVNLIADSKNWQGAFAELSAIDFLCSERDFLSQPPRLDVDIPGARTLTAALGNRGPANLDVHFEDFDVYADTKCLKDNSKEILEGIYEEVWPENPPFVGAETPLDLGPDDIQRERRAIVEALRDAEASGRNPKVVTVAALPRLRFRFDWSRRLLMTESSYSPYAHAQELHRLPFRHAKKFVTDRPCFLTFVVFPWFNNVVTEFLDSNKVLYRSLARRVYCQYRHSPDRFSQWQSRFTGPDTVHDVARYLGGILFLEDRTIKGTDSADRNAVGYYYENPNATHRPSELRMEQYLSSLRLSDLDYFEDDNY